jgi:hypothetical protein
MLRSLWMIAFYSVVVWTRKYCNGRYRRTCAKLGLVHCGRFESGVQIPADAEHFSSTLAHLQDVKNFFDRTWPSSGKKGKEDKLKRQGRVVDVPLG